jgi:hypothetical protein
MKRLKTGCFDYFRGILPGYPARIRTWNLPEIEDNTSRIMYRLTVGSAS